MEDEKVLDALESIKNEAAKNAVAAFNEGFLLGAQYAKQLYNQESK